MLYSPEQRRQKIALLPQDKLAQVQKQLAKISAIERADLADNARRDLCSFTTYTYPEYRPAWFHRYKFERLTAFAKGDVKRIIIEEPPRHGKSEAASRRLPAYIFGINPDSQIISCSYSDDLVSRNNRDVQRIIDSDRYRELFPNTHLHGKSVRSASNESWLRNTSMFEIVGRKGSYRSASIGSGITGMGMTHGLIDDYLKDAAQAGSPTYRDAIWEWYNSTFYTRRAPGAGICILATRWHEDDLIGRLLKQARENPNADQWEVIRFPAIAEEPLEPYDIRAVGEALWPEQYPLEELEKVRAQGAYYFAALYQQSPVAREGNVVQRAWFPENQLFDYKPTHRPVNLYFDLGGSSQATADRTVGTIDAQYRVAGDEYPLTILLHQMAGQWDSPEREERMEGYCVRANELFPGIPIYLENTFGLAKDIAPKIRNRLLAKGLNVMLDSARVSKFARAEPFLASARAGRVSLYSGDRFKELGYPNWRAEFLDEVTLLQQRETAKGPEFFGGKDDRLDSPVGGFNVMTAPKQTDYFAMN